MGTKPERCVVKARFFVGALQLQLLFFICRFVVENCIRKFIQIANRLGLMASNGKRLYCARKDSGSER